MRFKTISIAFFCTFFIFDIVAQELETLLITGSRLDASTSSAQSVLSREQIDALNPSTTVDLLKNIPNIIVSESGQAGGLSYVSIRGGESNFTLILIDGITVNDPTNSRGGGFDFNQLDPAVIERIEVYRGGVSAIYGGDAISGVIHFITRSATAAVASIEAGNQGQLSANLSLSKNLSENYNGLISLSSKQRKSSDTAEYENKQILMKVHGQTEKSQQSILISYNDQANVSFAEDSGGNLFAVPYLAERKASTQWLIGLNGQFNYSDDIGLNTKISWLRHQKKSAHPGIADGALSGIPASNINSDYKKVEGEVSATFHVNDNWTLLSGLNARKATGSNQGFLDFGFQLPVDFILKQETFSAFAESSWQYHDVSVDFGVRFDDPSDFSSEISYRANINLAFTHDASVYAAYNEGYKLPSFFALAHPLIGNSALKPERAKNLEMGIRNIWFTSVDWELVAFYNDFTDLVDFDPVLFTSINRSSVKTSGVEFNTFTKLSSWLRVNFDVSYMRTRTPNSDTELRRRPKWFGGLGAQANLGATRVVLSINSRSEFTDSSIATGAVTLGGFTTASLALHRQLKPNLNLSFNIDNLLDKTYQESVGFTSDEISYRLSLKYRL